MIGVCICKIEYGEHEFIGIPVIMDKRDSYSYCIEFSLKFYNIFFRYVFILRYLSREKDTPAGAFGL